MRGLEVRFGIEIEGEGRAECRWWRRNCEGMGAGGDGGGYDFGVGFGGGCVGGARGAVRAVRMGVGDDGGVAAGWDDADTRRRRGVGVVALDVHV